MPIKGLSEQRRMPRLGKIRLGRKVPTKDGNSERPEASKVFVLPPELEAIYGKECAELPIMIPVEDDELWASQYYKRYSLTRGLVCKGDGETCRRMLDAMTGAIANRETKEIVWKEGLPCDGMGCPDYKAKACKEVMHLQFIMPDVPGLGIWQIDTGSVNSIRNINSAAAMVRAVYKRLAFIPLLLTLEPVEVVNPDDGKKKIVRVLNLRVRGTMRELMLQAAKPFNELLLPAPVDTEPPADDGIDSIEVIPEAEVKPRPPDFLDGNKTEPSAPASVVVGIDMVWLDESLTKLHWKTATVLSYLKTVYGAASGTITESLLIMTLEQRAAFVKEIDERLKMR